MHCERLLSTRGIQEFTSIIDCDLSHNSIADLSGLSALVTVESLSLASNNIVTINVDLRLLTKLRSLNLSYNQLATLGNLATLPSSIRDLNLIRNQI